MRRKEIDETASRVVQEEMECFIQLGCLGNQLGGYPSKKSMKPPISFQRGDTHTENRRLGSLACKHGAEVFSDEITYNIGYRLLISYVNTDQQYSQMQYFQQESEISW